MRSERMLADQAAATMAGCLRMKTCATASGILTPHWTRQERLSRSAGCLVLPLMIRKGKDALSCALKETTASVASEGRGKVLEHTLSFSLLHHHSFCLLLAAKGFVAHRDDWCPQKASYQTETLQDSRIAQPLFIYNKATLLYYGRKIYHTTTCTTSTVYSATWRRQAVLLHGAYCPLCAL